MTTSSTPATNTALTAGQVALQTAESLAPAIATAIAASNPGAASALALAPIVIQLMQAATNAAQAGALTADQLATLFQHVGSGVLATHNAWNAMNATAAPPPAP